MSGHSRWSNIKNRKAKGDSVRAKIFTKIGREIAVAVKQGGADLEHNSKLKDIISKAKAANMPNDNITRGIKKAAGELGNVNYESIIYEGYGIGGVAVIVETLTDNKNRTAGDVRHYFDKFGGALGSLNCVSFMFDRKAIFIIEDEASISEDKLMELVLDAGAEDFIKSNEYEITANPADFSKLRQTLEDNGYKFLSADIEWIPQNTVKIEGDNLIKFNRMIETFEDLDDVQNVYHNAEFPEDFE